jgi:hypothetical protein
LLPAHSEAVAKETERQAVESCSPGRELRRTAQGRGQTAATVPVLPADLVIVPVESKQHENGTKEETLRWGEYTVAFFHYPNDRYPNNRLADVAQIRDSKGRVRIEVRHHKILGPLDEGGAVLRDFNGDGIPELRILGWSGGAYCCYTEYLFDRRGRLKNTLIYWGGE